MSRISARAKPSSPGTAPYPAGGMCEVLIGGRCYPVVTGGVSSAHTLVGVGLDGPVKVGDTATLIGPDDPAILPHEVASRGRLLPDDHQDEGAPAPAPGGGMTRTVHEGRSERGSRTRRNPK
jgi:hypothetical protein